MGRKIEFNDIAKTINKGSENKELIPSMLPSAPRETASQAGRRRRLRTKRENAITLYCTDEMMAQLEEVKYNNRIERQRLVQTALWDFLQRHFDGRQLDTEGRLQVERFEKIILME